MPVAVKTVKGFGVSSQGRTRIRKPLSGVYREQRPWRVEYARAGVFEWSVRSKQNNAPGSGAVLRGFTPPQSTVATALMEIREAVNLMENVERYGRRVTQDLADQLNLLQRWTRLALQGRLGITMKRRRNQARDVYHTVEERT